MGALLGGNSFSLTTVITVIFFVLVIFGALKGLRRGFMRQMVRTITIIASAALSFVAFTGISDKITAFLDGKTVGDVMAELGVAQTTDTAYMALISGFSTEALSGVFHIFFALILLPVLFTTGFFALSAIGEVLHVILSAILGFKKSKNSFITRILGMALGSLQGVLVAAILFFPVANGAAIVSEIEDTSNQTVSEITSVAKEISDNPAISFTMKFGGNALAEKFATTDLDGEKYDARDAAKLFIEIYSNANELQGFTYTLPSENDKAIINEMEDKLFSDTFVKKTVSGILSELAIANNEGRINISLDEPFNEMLKSVISVFMDSTSENIEPDMQTILNVYFILADSGALEAVTEGGADVREIFTSDDGEGTVISRVIDELSDNERTKPITTMLAKLTLSIMSESLDLGVDAEATYNTVVDCLTDITTIDPTLSEDEYTEAVADIINDTLASEGVNIELDEEIVDEMAKYVYDEYRGADITEDAINDILLSYFEAYANKSV